VRTRAEATVFADLTAFTWLHTILSLVMLVAGVAMMLGMFHSQGRRGWTALFLLTGVLTSVTGFGFLPIDKLLPSHYVGILSLILLAIALLARYAFHLAEPWRWIFVVTAMIAFYLDAFVLVVQIFRKVPGLGGEGSPGFIGAQGALFVLFAYWTYKAVKGYHPAS
jgi:hypothetical protein